MRGTRFRFTTWRSLVPIEGSVKRTSGFCAGRVKKKEWESLHGSLSLVLLPDHEVFAKQGLVSIGVPWDESVNTFPTNLPRSAGGFFLLVAAQGVLPDHVAQQRWMAQERGLDLRGFALVCRNHCFCCIKSPCY